MTMKYKNMPEGVSKVNFTFRYLFNQFRSWYLFNFKYPWVKTSGFTRVMKNTSFARKKISLGNYVQFGNDCKIATHLSTGDYVLFAGGVMIVGRNDHSIDVPGKLIWDGSRRDDDKVVIESDVWVGAAVLILGGVHIGSGSVIAAGSVVTKNIPECEIWGGVPARKIRDRFHSTEDKIKHIDFLKQQPH